MKGAAELLGVTYASLYGRYRESFGNLKKTNKQATKAEDLDDHFVFEEDLVEKVHNHNSKNFS